MRKNKKAAILSIAAQKYDDIYVSFLRELLERSNEGIVYNYILKHQEEIVNKVFKNDRVKYIEVYSKLVKDNFLTSKGLDLHILPWEDHVLFAFKYNLKQDKRIYRKDPVRDQVRFSDYSKKVLNEESEEKEVKYNINWDKLKGIRIPRNFKDLLSGLENNFTYTKEKIRYLLGLITLADTDGVIQAYTVQYAHERLKEIFEDKTIALSTCYDVNKKLMEDGIISIYDTPSGYQNLRIQGYKDGFKKGYIAVSYFIFQKQFKKMETAAVKIFFDTIFKHNNGDNGKGIIDRNKPVIFKIDTYSGDNKDSLLRHIKTLDRLKKRCRSEILKLFSGNSKNIGLNSVFDVDLHQIKRGLIYLRLKRKYFIKKSEAIKASFFNASIRFKRKAEIIRSELKDTLIKLDPKGFNEIVNKLHKTNKRAIRATINIVNNQLKEQNRIIDLTGYIIAVYGRYAAGERVKLSPTDITASIINNIPNPFDSLSLSN